MRAQEKVLFAGSSRWLSLTLIELGGIIVLALSLLGASGETITQWNFNSPTPDADATTGTNIPSMGSGAASLIGGTTATFATGDTKNDPAGSSDNSAWNTSHYPARTSNSLSAGVRFAADTTGFKDLSISWCQQNSATASRYVRLQVSPDGVHFTNSEVFAATIASVFTNKTVVLATNLGAANNPNFAFQIVAEFESTAAGSGSNAYVATGSTNSYSTGGTIRFDMVTVSGTHIPGVNNAPVISAISNQTLRVSQSTQPLSFRIGDAEDAPESLVLSKASSDPAIIPEANIILSRSGSNCTATLTATAQAGSALVTLGVIDTGGRSNTTSFTVLVLPANTAPTISSLLTIATLLNTPTPEISFTVGDLETPAASLVVSAVSANPILVPNLPANLTLGGFGADRHLVVTPAAGQTGVAPITLTVSDGTNTASSLFPLMVLPSTNVLFYDPFSYADGSLVTNSAFLWGSHTGTAGSCQVTNGQLLVTATQSEDVLASLVDGPYTRSNGTVLYAGLQATFLSLPKVKPDYFAEFAGGAYHGRLYTGITNAATGCFRLFLTNNTGSLTPWPVDLNTNTVMTLVARYDLDSGNSTLWVNPGSETNSSITATDPQALSSISSYIFRQDSAVGAAVLIDNFKIGLSFASVMPTAATTPALTIQTAGRNVILRWTDSAAALQAAPAATGTFTNIPGAASPFTNPIAGSARFFRLKPN